MPLAPEHLNHQQVDVLHETRANSVLAQSRYALAACCVTTMSTDFSNRRRFTSSNIGTLLITLGLRNRSSVNFLLMSSAALRSFSLEAENWVHDERRNVINVLYAAIRHHAYHDLLLRQCACIGSNILHKSYSQSFNDLVLQFDLSPGCSFAMHCCRRLFGIQLHARRICDPRHVHHSDEMRHLLLWIALCHFLGNCCNSNSTEGMYVGGLLISAGFVHWLKSTLPGFTAIIPAEPVVSEHDSRNSSDAAAPVIAGRRQSQSGLLYRHTSTTYEEYTARATEDGSEELNLTKSHKISIRSVAQSDLKISRRPSTAIRTDTFDSWNQHGMRTLTFSSDSSTSGSTVSSTSVLKHAIPAAAAVVEAAICQLMRLISNFGELLPSILLTAPYDTERVKHESRATPPSVNGVELLCDHMLLPKVLDFFEAALQYRSAALHAAAVLLKMQDRNMMDADIAARIQSLLLNICRRYFPKIMKNELHEFVCIAPRCLPNVPSTAELHQLVGVAYENIDLEIQKLLRGNSDQVF